MKRILLAGLLAASFACSHAQVAAPVAAKQVESVSKDYLAIVEREAANDPGRVALASYVLTGDPAHATPWIDKALAANPNDAQALYARLMIAHEALNDREEAEMALAILKNAPKSEFAELAAFRLREVAGLSPAIDRMILDGLAGLKSGSMGLEGHAAYRARETLAGVGEAHNDDAALAQARSDLGTPTAWTVIGPLQPTRTRNFDNDDGFEDPKRLLDTSFPSALGAIAPRVFETPSGVIDMDHETWRADVFEALTDVDAKTGGTYLLALRGAAEADVYVDGTKVAERRPLPTRPPDRTWVAVQMGAGKHRVRVKFARIDGGWLSLVVPRADGSPSDLAFAAASGVASTGTATAVASQSDKSAPLDPVKEFLRIQMHAPDDGDRARGEMEKLLAEAGDSAAVRSLDADLTSGDQDLPRANITGRVAQDLDAALKVNPADARALLGRFQQERNDKRYEPAADRLAKLTAVVGEAHPHVTMERARFALDQGNVAQARELADAALKADPGRCEALGFRVDLARRDMELGLVRDLTPALMGCPTGLAVNAQYFRNTGKTADAVPLLSRLFARNPSGIQPRRQLADALFALGDTKGAQATIDPLITLWPHDDDALKKLATWRELNGDEAGSMDLLQRALSVDSADLTLARGLAAEANHEILPWAHRDGLAAIDAFRKSGFTSNAPAIQVLDFGALEIQPDGSTLERTQSVVQVLDKRGIQQFGEVSIPGDAQPLLLRTIKADGEILDAESISGKETLSAPNLEPGDFVEFAFVRAQPPRPTSMPGWQGGQFLFQAHDVPFFESTYVVHAPASIGMNVDFANIDPAPKVERDGDMLTLTYTNHQAEPHLPEPYAVSDLELLPWVEAGSGASADSVAAQYADWAPLRARVTHTVQAFVRGTEQMPPQGVIHALVDRIRNDLRAESQSMDFSDSAATILARKRGNRLIVLKAALAADGIPSHIVIARPFNECPHEFKFPHAASYRAAVLRIEPPGSEPVWMDFSLREAPLGKLPGVLSGMEAYVVPNTPAEKVERIQLPKVNAEDDRTDAQMDLNLTADGTLTGTLTQSAYGFDAAALRWRLEQINATELRKQQERMLARTFRGLTLTDFTIQDSGDPTTPVVAKSTISVPGFSDRGNGARVFAANFGPLELGRRFVNRADRRTPLLLSMDDVSRTHVIVHLPLGTNLDTPQAVGLTTPFGSYAQSWKLDGATLTMDEEFIVKRGRVTPDQYGAFKSFAAAVDAAQSRDVTLASR